MDFEHFGDYASASLSGAGNVIARFINALSLIGVALIAVAAFVFKLDFESVGVSFIAFAVLVLATHYGSFVAYQTERRRVTDLEAELAKRARVEVHCAYPVLHTEGGVQPFGDYILIPALNIINRTDRPVDCDLELEVELMVDGGTSLLPLESSEIVNARMSLPGTLKGNKQYMDPIRIASESRDVGFAAFRADEVHIPSEVDAEWSKVERMTLGIWDAVNHVQIAEHEVWPAMWLSIREQDVEINIGDRMVIPTNRPADEITPTQQSSPDKVAFLPRRAL